MTAETKGIPLAHALARLLGEKRFVVARKSVKGYMEHPLIERDRSITTAGEQILVLQDEDAALLRGKRVLLVDDVISTGGSMRAMEALARRAGPMCAAGRPFSPKGMRPPGRTSSIWRNCPFSRPSERKTFCCDTGFLWYNLS